MSDLNAAPSRIKDLWHACREVLTSFGTSLHKWFVLATIVGVITGFGVAGASLIAEHYFESRVLAAGSIWIFLFIPVLGLGVAALVIRYLTPDRNPDTTEAFLENYHSPGEYLGWRSLPAKIAAAVFTVGSGGSMGFEGPSIYLGAVTGSEAQQLSHKQFRGDESKVMTVAGAAAGLSAIFRAPLTGVMFSIEGPYMFDLVRFAVAPALVASAASYLVYTAIRGTTPFFQVEGFASVRAVELLGAVVIGVASALAMRLFLWIIKITGGVFKPLPVWLRVVIGGFLLSALAVISFELTGSPITLGEGVRGAQRFLVGDISSPFMGIVPLLVLLVVMKMIATAATMKAGGVGGVFFPLSFIGAGLGAAFHAILPAGDPSLYPVVGIAAMISAAFRAPLTGAAFVAETTGATSFLIPGLLAAAAATSLMGKKSVSGVQVEHERSVVTASRRIPLSQMIDKSATPRVVAPEMSLTEYAAGGWTEPALVEDGDDVVGLMDEDCLFKCRLQDRDTTTVRDVMDAKPVRLDATTALRDAASQLLRKQKRYAVVFADGEPLGFVSDTQILQRQEGRLIADGSDMD